LRRHKPRRHENHERWLVSYADFITLLFAFFVVMFAATQKNEAKQVSASVRDALEHGQLSAALNTALGRGKHEAAKTPVTLDQNVTHEAPPAPAEPERPPAEPERHPADLTKSLAKLQEVLAEELKSGKVQLRMDARGLTISLREAGFFGSGDATVQPASIPAIGKIAAVIRDLPNSVRLEGHTDAQPIHTSRFHSNWDLSTARAIAMLELLRDRFEIPTGSMAVAGYAENAPADTNETEEGRAHNRRVDVVILSAEGMKSEPIAVPSK
jgi:chemotaxis protein MotB